MIREEIKHINQTKDALKKFGITMGVVFLLIAIVLFITGKNLFIVFLSLSVLFLVSALIVPQILKPFNKVWMILAILLGWFMTRVILSVLFYLILTPIGIIGRLFGKKFLDLKINRQSESYWNLRERKKIDNHEYERQF